MFSLVEFNNKRKKCADVEVMSRETLMKKSNWLFEWNKTGTTSSRRLLLAGAVNFMSEVTVFKSVY